MLAADALRSGYRSSPLRPPVPPSDPDNTVVLTTKHGKVTILLHPDWAPKTVAQFKTLVKDKFYDGLTFHRVIPGFMAQTGDPTGTGGGGSKLPNLPAEFNQTHFKRGILGMARTDDPNSANSQFFIMFGDGGFLDGKYTAFGEVVSGMDVVDKIKAGTEANNGAVENPDKIVTMRMASGAKNKEQRHEQPRRHADARDEQRPGGDRNEPGRSRRAMSRISSASSPRASMTASSFIA